MPCAIAGIRLWLPQAYGIVLGPTTAGVLYQVSGLSI